VPALIFLRKCLYAKHFPLALPSLKSDKRAREIEKKSRITKLNDGSTHGLRVQAFRLRGFRSIPTSDATGFRSAFAAFAVSRLLRSASIISTTLAAGFFA
jgi:hypothetical protein